MGLVNAEDLLLEREAELWEAQRLAEVGSWSWDIRTVIVRWFEELSRIMGHDPNLPVSSYPVQLDPTRPSRARDQADRQTRTLRPKKHCRPRR